MPETITSEEIADGTITVGGDLPPGAQSGGFTSNGEDESGITPDPATMTTEHLDQVREVRETTYTVMVSPNPDKVPEGGEPIVERYTPVGLFTVSGGQRAARAAAIEATPQIKEAVLAGAEPLIAAVANFQPTPARVKNAEPTIAV